MRIVSVLRSVILTFGILGLVAAAQAADKPGVVIQVSDANPAVWGLALNNAKNIHDELGKDKMDIEIVAFGPGIDMFRRESKVASRLKEAEASGIALRACGNTMKSQKMTDKDLAPGIKVVNSGVVEIIQKQKEGWGYLMP